MKKAIALIFEFTGFLYSQSLTVTSPANNAVVTWGFPLTATFASAPNIDRCDFYIDGRIEDIDNHPIHTDSLSAGSGRCQVPQMLYATYSDYARANIYVIGYDSLGNVVTTSATNTFRVDNAGANVTQAVTCGGGTIPNLGMLSGTCTVTATKNATPTGSVQPPQSNLDGWSYDNYNRIYFKNSGVSTSTGAITVPAIWYHEGTHVTLGCINAAQTGSCTGALPSGLPTSGYLHILGANSICVTSSPGGSCIVPTNQGVTTEYGQMYTTTVGPDWLSQRTPLIFDSTYVPNGLHRVETTWFAWTLGASYTSNFLASAINASTGVVAQPNHPFVQNEVFTCAGVSGGACPSQWTGTLYAQVIDANDWCPSLSQNGACIPSLTGQSGTVQASFTVPYTFTAPEYADQVLGTDIQQFDVENGTVPMALKTKYSKIVGISGDTFTLAPYYLCTDGTVSGQGSCPSPTGLTYSTTDSGRVTINSGTGLATLHAGSVFDSSTNGWAVITLTSQLSSTTGRTTYVDVEIRPDRVTYNHIGLPGCAGNTTGIYASYQAGCSKAVQSPFATIGNLLIMNPKPKALIAPVVNGIRATVNATTIHADGGVTGNAGTYANWLSTWWNSGNTSYSSAAFDAQVAGVRPILTYSEPAIAGISGYNLWRFYQDTWRQQALQTILSYVAPVHLGWEHFDEASGYVGNMPYPRGDIGSGQDGLGNFTIAGHPAGFDHVTVTCGASVPCDGTITFYGNMWRWIRGTNFYATGASHACLNGPYVLQSSTLGYDSPLDTYWTSITSPMHDCVSGTYDKTSDPGLTILSNQFGYVNTPGPSTTGHAAANGYNGYAFGESGGPLGLTSTIGALGSSMTCASNTCSETWTNHPFTVSRQAISVGGFSASGLNGYWPVTVTDANHISFRVASVADGTYSDASGYQDALGFYPQNFISKLFTNPSGYFTAQHPPFGSSITGGYGCTLCWVAWEGSSYLDYGVQNTNPAAPYDRYGGLIQNYRHLKHVETPQTLADGSLFINYLNDKLKGRLYQVQFNGATCSKIVRSIDCKMSQVPGDLYSAGPTGGGVTFSSAEMIWAGYKNSVGAIPYQYGGSVGIGRNPSGPFTPGTQAFFQSPPFEAGLYPDEWLANAAVANWSQHEDKYLVSPLLSSPDQNVGPGPFPQVECQSHTATYGNSMDCENLSETPQIGKFDLSLINPTGTCGSLRRWRKTRFGNTLSELTPTLTSDTLTLLYSESVHYICQPSGGTDDLVTIHGLTLVPRYGATKAAVEIHYYPQDKVWQTIDCGTGACPDFQVNLHNLDVYIRKRFTKSDGTPVMAGDLERLPAQ